jgi:tetratricopeptide (TPR) repeat protein
VTPDEETEDARSSEERFAGADLRWLLLAMLASVVVFWRAHEGELVYDDLLLIGRNPLITDLANVPTLFARPYWGFLETDAGRDVGYWRPLTATVQTITWVLGDGRPAAFHLTSILAHALATGAAFLLARRLARRAWVAGFAALLFGLHPVHVESVAWISALNDPLFALFGFLALERFLAWRDRGSRGTTVAAGALFLTALFCKEMAIGILPLALGLDLVRRRVATGGWRPRAAARAYLPFGIAFAVYFLARVAIFRDPQGGLAPPSDFGVGTLRLVLLRLELWGGSLALLTWPADLNVFRPFRPTLAWSDPDALIALAATVASVVVFVALLRRRAKGELQAFLILPLGLSPVLLAATSLGIFPLSDRFLYLPVLGFTLLLSLVVARLAPKHLALVVLAAVGGLYGRASWNRIDVWRDEETLFRNAVAESPRSPYLRWGLGRVLLERVGATEDRRALDEAFRVFEEAGELLIEAKRPDTDIYVTSNDYMQTNLGLGLCYVLEARLDEYGGYGTAIAIFENLAREIGEIRDRTREVRELGIQVVDQHLELELVYAALGSAHYLEGNDVESKSALRKALALNPRCADAHMTMGRLFSRQGEWNVAIHHLREAFALQPGDYETKLALAQALRESGRRADAEELAQELVEHADATPEAMLIVAANLLEDRRAREALSWIDRAIKKDPLHAHSWFLKAMAMQSLGVNQQATIEAFRRATDLAPDHFLANYNFGNLLLQSGAESAALPFLVAAYGLSNEPAHVGALYTVLNVATYDSPDLLFDLAQADGQRGRLDLAESWLDRALALDPDHPGSLFQKGRLLRQQERHEEALALMRRACQLEPGFVVLVETAEYLRTRGLLVEAQELLVRALALPRPESWEEEAYQSGREQVQALIDQILEELPPSNAIGPPVSGEG